MGATCETCEHQFTSEEIQDGELFESAAVVDIRCSECGSHTRVSVKSLEGVI